MAGNVHVVPEADGKWAVRIEGTDGTGPTYETQQEAIASGTEAAQQAKVELIIHGRCGGVSGLAQSKIGPKVEKSQ